MKRRRPFIQLLLITGLLFMAITSCDKTDNLGSEFPSAGTFKDTDGNEYNTVQIGTQIWMAENLKTTKYNDSTEIPYLEDYLEWSMTDKGAYCNYLDQEKNADIYGRLYNWYTINTGKLAPAGWHVPNDSDFTILENYLISNGYNYDSTKYDNKIPKSLASTYGWNISDVPGGPGTNPADNNRTHFSALPGGFRNFKGQYLGIKETGYWWCSNEDEWNNVYCRRLYLDSPDFYCRDDSGKNFGFSIRLVKD